MGSNPFGIKVEESGEKNIIRALFYFMREFKFNPLDEEYIVENEGKITRIIKKGLPIPLFNAMLNELEEQLKREAADMKKGRKR